MNWQQQVSDFKSKLQISSPSIQAGFVRFGFFGLVGGGKSVTSGVLALGITPKDGLIGWIDGEGRRSGYAIDQLADMASKHYDQPKSSFIDRFRVVHLDPPFNPLAAVAAMETLESAGCKTIVCDCCSQMWDSEGGYLDMREEEIDKMAGGDAQKRNRVASSAAAHIKPWTHGKFVSRVNSIRVHVVLVFQAKAKWNAKQNKVDEFYSPIQESGLTRTALAVGYVETNENGVGGFCKFQLPVGQGTKYTHPGLLACLPKNGDQFTFGHAESIARWCIGDVVASQPKTTPDDKALKAAKARLWKLTESQHHGNPEALHQWMWDEIILSDDQRLSDLNASQIERLIPLVEEKLKGVTA